MSGCRLQVAGCNLQSLEGGAQMVVESSRRRGVGYMTARTAPSLGWRRSLGMTSKQLARPMRGSVSSLAAAVQDLVVLVAAVSYFPGLRAKGISREG